MKKKEANPKISVVTSVFNGGAFLSPAVESILGQTFTDLEFIVVDDGSTDQSWAVLNEYARKDERMILHRNSGNIGLTRSLNLGLSLARGEYFARFDADDIALPQRIERQAAFLDSHPDIDLVGCRARLVEEDGSLIGESVPPMYDEAIKAELLLKNYFGHPEIMARMQTIRAVGGYDESIPFAQDYDLWRRLIPGAKFASLPEALYIWRNRKQNISNSKRLAQLECMFSTSVRLVRETMSSRERLDEDAYRRVWFAFHGRVDMMRDGDIERLEPFWTLLQERASLLEKTSEGFAALGLNLLRHGRLGTGFAMLRIVRERLGRAVPRKQIAICFLGCMKRRFARPALD